MGLFSSRKSSVKKEAKFAEPPAAAPAPAAVAATSSDDLSLQKTEGFRRGSALATKQDLEAATLADFDVVRAKRTSARRPGPCSSRPAPI